MQPSNCLGSSPTLQPPHFHTKMPCTHPFRERLLPNSCILPTDGSTTHYSLSPSHLPLAGCHSCSGKGGKGYMCEWFGHISTGATMRTRMFRGNTELYERSMHELRPDKYVCYAPGSTERCG